VPNKNMRLNKKQRRTIRHKQIRRKIFGSAKKPRLVAFRSNIHIYAQIIDDKNKKTIVSASDFELEKVKDKVKKSKVEKAKEVGKLIGQKALAKKISEIVFDRAGYKYHGRIKSLAEGAREAGLKF